MRNKTYSIEKNIFSSTQENGVIVIELRLYISFNAKMLYIQLNATTKKYRKN